MSTTEKPARSNTPTHYAYHLRDGEAKSYWSRIGAAWAHNDGQGFNLQIDSVPLDGKITLRIATEKKDTL